MSHFELINQLKLLELLRDQLLERSLLFILRSVELPVFGRKQCADCVLTGIADTLRFAARPVVESLAFGTQRPEVAHRSQEPFHLQAEVLHEVCVLVVGRDLFRKAVELGGSA